MMTAGLNLNICGNAKTQSKRVSKESLTEQKHCHGESVLKMTLNKVVYQPFSSNTSDSEQGLEGDGIARRTRAGRTLRNRKYRRAFEENRQTKRLFTPEIKKFLKGWLVRRRKNPYPNRNEKKELAVKTGLTYIQICNWFANWRRKLKNSCNEQQRRTWGHLIKDYNTQAHGNVEQFSISSNDSIWDESAYKKDSEDPCSSTYKAASAYDHSYTTDRTDYKIQAVGNSKSENKIQTNHFVNFDEKNVINFQKNCETSNPKIKPTILHNSVTKQNKIDTPILLSKWLQSAEKFRPRESYIWSTPNMTWQNSVSRQLPKTKPHLNTDGLLLGRHREELDAAEALTYLSYSPILKFQRQFPAISGH